MRPPDYKPEYCNRIIELGKQGYSQARMAADIGVAKSTITAWSKQHEEFSNALSLARTYSQAFHEKTGMSNFETREFNTPLYLGMMKSMFRDDYMDRSAHHHLGKDEDSPIEVNDSNADARRVAFMLGRAVGRAEATAKQSEPTE